MATRQQQLAAIMTAESGGRNVYNYMYNTNPNYYTASGYYQIVNSTWKQGAQWAGVDTSQYPTAISAPYEVQTQVANALIDHQGLQPWSGSRANSLINQIDTGGNPTLVNAPVDGGGGATTTLASNTPDTSGQGYGSNGTSTTGGGGASYTDPTTLQTYTATPGSSSVTASGPGYGTAVQVGVESTLLSDLNTWIGGIKTSIGNWMTNLLGYAFGSVANWFARIGLIILGFILLMFALWRILDPSGEKTKAVAEHVAAAA